MSVSDFVVNMNSGRDTSIITNFISTSKPQEEDRGCSYGLSFLLAIISFLATEVFLAVDHGGDEDVMQIEYHADAADADAYTIYADNHQVSALLAFSAYMEQLMMTMMILSV